MVYLCTTLVITDGDRLGFMSLFSADFARSEITTDPSGV